MPSDDWCRWFMRKHLDLVPRRITGSAATPEQQATQERIHQGNIRRLSLLIHEGLPLKYIFGSDEFGCHYFMCDKYIWAKKGASHVSHAAGINVRSSR